MTCYICRLPKDEHGPNRNGLVYAAPNGWHEYTTSGDRNACVPPPYPARTGQRRRVPLELDQAAPALPEPAAPPRLLEPIRVAAAPAVPRPQTWWGRWRQLLRGHQ